MTTRRLIVFFASRINIGHLSAPDRTRPSPFSSSLCTSRTVFTLQDAPETTIPRRLIPEVLAKVLEDSTLVPEIKFGRVSTLDDAERFRACNLDVQNILALCLPEEYEEPEEYEDLLHTHRPYSCTPPPRRHTASRRCSWQGQSYPACCTHACTLLKASASPPPKKTHRLLEVLFARRITSGFTSEPDILMIADHHLARQITVGCLSTEAEAKRFRVFMLAELQCKSAQLDPPYDFLRFEKVEKEKVEKVKNQWERLACLFEKFEKEKVEKERVEKEQLACLLEIIEDLE